jgi:hypothetical protein
MAVFMATTAFAADDLANAMVFPNPARPFLGQSTATFAQLTPGAQIRIYNLRGSLIRDVSAPGTTFAWDLKNEAGADVASGVYVYLITDGAGHQRTGKVAIVR